MPRIQLKFNAAAPQDQLAAISTEFPDEESEILASHRSDDRPIGVIVVRTTNGDAIARYFEGSADVPSSEVTFPMNNLFYSNTRFRFLNHFA